MDAVSPKPRDIGRLGLSAVCNGILSHFRIWDVNQKTFYLRNNQLVAGYLQGPNTKLEGKRLLGTPMLCRLGHPARGCIIVASV